ncbi:MAG: tRNA (N6-threonylcarbamoyladenosine(37)-N6)-methyltransferase TrmO [Candidatus Hydrogenedentota bacterium]
MYLEPIGVFECAEQHPYDAPRQPVLAQDNRGTVVLHVHANYEQALQDLEGFSRIWLIYVFHKNTGWKPLVQPPRAARKVGVFASRAPYRPNPIGLSCVELLRVHGRRIEVGAHDLLDGTPILDIKPYIPYADSFPDADTGWLEEVETTPWRVTFSGEAAQRLAWIEEKGAGSMRAFLVQQLQERPFDTDRKRVRVLGEATWEIAYRTWRARFTADEAAQEILVEQVYSGYTAADLATDDDPHGDKLLHRRFLEVFQDNV